MDRKEDPGIDRPLLEEMGHYELLSMLTPEEFHAAQKLLAPFLKEYGPAGVEPVAVLAYLFGVKQGCHEVYGGKVRRNLISHLVNANYIGKVYGFIQAMLFFGKLEISPQILPRFDFRPKDE